MKTVQCQCGKNYDARAKTKMCLTCYRRFIRINKKPYSDGSQCKDSSGLTHYQRNKKEYLKRNRLRIRELYKFVNEYKMNHPCVDCGNKDFRVLEFDHVSGKKEIDVSKAVRTGWSKERILSEIGKCEVRCSNCHTIKTIERKQNPN